MIDISNKIFVLSALALIGAFQIYAWYSGHDGAVFASTSALMAALVGFAIGHKTLKS